MSPKKAGKDRLPRLKKAPKLQLSSFHIARKHGRLGVRVILGDGKTTLWSNCSKFTRFII